MPRTSRYRTRPGKTTKGTVRIDFLQYIGVPVTKTQSFNQDACTDMTGAPVVDSGFSSLQHRGDIPYINGEGTSGGWVCTFSSYPAAGALAPPVALPVPSGWMLSLVAGTNPSRPVVTPPTLIQDMVELPKMLREAGRFLRNPKAYLPPKGMANIFLGVKFGWAPLIEDITTLLNLQSAVNKRIKELHQLYSGQGVRRRLKFSESNETTSGQVALVSMGGVTAHLEYDVVTTKKQWATIRWKPSVSLPFAPGDDFINQQARQIVLGLTPEGLAKGAWDVIPWTWLIGWFTNVGKYALAYSNTVPANHGAGCFMNFVEYKVTPKRIVYVGNWTKKQLMVHGGYTISSRSRYVSSTVSAGANLPMLDGSQLSVLGALFVQRFKR